MSTATIDLDALNNLFDNQKKLDDIFSSIFDDDSYLISPTLVAEQASESNDQKSNQDYDSYEDFSFYAEDTTFVQKKRSIFSIVIPIVIEIAVIIYCIIYFS